MSSNPRIKDMAVQDRPRERLVRDGVVSLSKADLLAILLRTGLKGCSVLDVAHQMLARFGSLDALCRASWEDLSQIKGVGRDKAVTLVAAFELARRMAAEIRAESPLIDTAERVADLFREDGRMQAVEEFRVLLLNTRRRLIRDEVISQGTVDTILVHAREVFRPAILANASAIVLVHNHPSGDPTPSEADIKVTRDLIRAGQLLKIDVMDHVIIGRPTSDRAKYWVSLRDLGYFYS